MVASALATYKELTLHFHLIGEKSIADEIVSCQLESDSQNPRLPCTLADLRSDPLYSKVLGNSFAQTPTPQCSLARQAIEKKDYEAAARLWMDNRRRETHTPLTVISEILQSHRGSNRERRHLSVPPAVTEYCQTNRTA